MFKALAALTFVAALAVGATAGVPTHGTVRVTQLVPAKATGRVNHMQLRAEGTLLGSPKAGVDLRLAKLVEPGVMSIAFSDQATAWDYYHEAVGNGEQVCLSDLGPQRPQFHGQRYWLRSC